MFLIFSDSPIKTMLLKYFGENINHMYKNLQIRIGMEIIKKKVPYL
jgi:hypothetical protein